MFKGYSNETFEFFMALSFNNNRPFFQENRDWYLRAVREPSIALAEELSEVVEEMDPDFERRPYRVLSHINRDVRFSKDKSPYRDNLWLGYKRAGEPNSAMGVYFDLSCAGSSYGLGSYKEDRAMMRGLRKHLETEPEAFMHIWTPLADEFTMYIEPSKRLKAPEGLPVELAALYCAKHFYVAKDLKDFDLIKSPQLAYEVREGFRKMIPLYKYLRDVSDEEI